MKQKQCCSCEQFLPVERFGKNRASRDGLQTYCKDCRRLRAQTKDREKIAAYQRQYREDNKGLLSDYSKSKYAANPDVAKARAKQWREDNPKRKKELDRLWRQNNRERHNENTRAWIRKNKQRRQEICQKYDQAHKEQSRIRAAQRRARKQSNGIVKYSPEQLLGKLQYWGYRCYLCNEYLDDSLHWDHVKPISKGGPDMLSNLRPTHRVCNQTKGGKWPPERIGD